MGYHKREISRGTFGEISKIDEELEELRDAVEQGDRILALNEICDLVGAIEGYLNKNYLDIDIDDIIKMMNKTKEAFKCGRRG